MLQNKGFYIDRDGYKIIHINRKHYREHRVIMENFLGRKLLTTEIIHHINHNKLDNRVENLEIVSRSDHKNKYHPLDWRIGVKTQLKKGNKYEFRKGEHISRSTEFKKGHQHSEEWKARQSLIMMGNNFAKKCAPNDLCSKNYPNVK